MGDGGGRLSEAEAHLELLLLDSRVAGVINESFVDRFRRLDLTHSDILERVAALLDETRICGDRIIHIGKILADQILRFIERKPDISSGFQLEVATRVLSDLAPPVGSLLAPLASEMEYQGFGGVFRGTDFVNEVEANARLFFKDCTTTFNLSKEMLFGQEQIEAAAPSIRQPDLFELDPSENPFDLDELESISPLVQGIVKFFAKIAMADGRFENEERAFVHKMLEGFGEAVSHVQFERLISEAPKHSLEDTLQVTEHQSEMLKDKLLLAAMLLTAADGKVGPIEKKMLVQAAHLLGISRERYSQLGGDALEMMKSHHGLQSQADAIRLPGTPVDVPDHPSPPATAAHKLPDAPPSSGVAYGRQDCQSVTPVSPQPQTPPARSGTDEPQTPNETDAAPCTDHQDGAGESRTEARQLWFCPACRMPQFFQFSECPQCGVIVSKWLRRSEEIPSDVQPVDYIEIPDEPTDATEHVSPREGPVTGSSGAEGLCPNCREAVPMGAKYCAFCGTRVA